MGAGRLDLDHSGGALSIVRAGGQAGLPGVSPAPHAADHSSRSSTYVYGTGHGRMVAVERGARSMVAREPGALGAQLAGHVAGANPAAQ
jgi:hypothetical protein